MPGRPILHTPERPVLHSPEWPVLHSPELPVLHMPERPVLHMPGRLVLHMPERPVLHSPGWPVLHTPERPVLHMPGRPAVLQIDFHRMYRTVHLPLPSSDTSDKSFLLPAAVLVKPAFQSLIHIHCKIQSWQKSVLRNSDNWPFLLIHSAVAYTGLSVPYWLQSDRKVPLTVPLHLPHNFQNSIFRLLCKDYSAFPLPL